jgi:hypothetical protein
MKMHELDTTGWNAFPFEVDGVNFVSKISPTSPFMSKIKMLPAGVFEEMNRSAVLEIVGKNLSREYMISKLYHVNENASHAVIELAGE